MICGIRYQTKGFENFPDGPVIVLSKHQSAWETIFLLMATPRPLVFVFKKSITYIPFFGWAIALMRMIPIDRSKGKDAFAQVVVVAITELVAHPVRPAYLPRHALAGPGCVVVSDDVSAR